MSLLKLLLKRFVPQPVADFTPLPYEISTNLWGLDRRLRFPGGMHLPTSSFLIRLSDGSLIVISAPPAVDSNCIAAINAIGKVKYVVAPNTFHYVFASEFISQYPNADMLIAPGTLVRAPQLSYAQELGPASLDIWNGELQYLFIQPSNDVSEMVFFHLSTKTLIITDLAFNITHFSRLIDKIGWQLGGIPPGFGPARTSRRLLLCDRNHAVTFLNKILDWPIQQIVLAHGDVVKQNAKMTFQKGFARYMAIGN